MGQCSLMSLRIRLSFYKNWSERAGGAAQPLARRGGDGSDGGCGGVGAWGRERGAELLTLEAFAASTVSVPFYEDRMGYERQAIVFVKRLRET